MPDEITGVLVLQRTHTDGVFYLHFQYRCSDGEYSQSYIPMIEKGTAPPPEWEGPLWRFVRRNPWLDCSPSVRILGATKDSPDHFHNAGEWSNHYVEMAEVLGSDPSGYELVQEINWPAEKTKAEKDAIIGAHRAKGVLL